MRAIIAILAIVVWCQSVAALDQPGPLVTTDWLAANRDAVTVVDVRTDESSFTVDGHIPGSLFVPWSTIRTTRLENGIKLAYMIPTADQFATTMRNAGVNKDDFIVVAHPGKKAGQVSMAARLYWQLKYFGHDRVALLDGGVLKWKDEGRPLERELALPDEGTFESTAERTELLATTADVEAALDSGDVQLADTRSLPLYLGTEKRSYVADFGHLPGAKFYPFDVQVTEQAPHLILQPEIQKNIAVALSVDPAAPTIVYCNSGNEAAGTWFIMHELLGNQNVRLYDGSLHAWTAGGVKRPLVKLKME